MQKIMMIGIILLLAANLTGGVTAYTRAQVKARASICISTSERALISVIQAPSEEPLTASIRITNNTEHGITVKDIACIEKEFKIEFAEKDVFIGEGRSRIISINLIPGKSEKPGPKDIHVNIHVIWDGGSAEIHQKLAIEIPKAERIIKEEAGVECDEVVQFNDDKASDNDEAVQPNDNKASDNKEEVDQQSIEAVKENSEKEKNQYDIEEQPPIQGRQ